MNSRWFPLTAALASLAHAQDSIGLTMASGAAITFEAPAGSNVVRKLPGYDGYETPAAVGPDFTTLPTNAVRISAMSLGLETINVLHGVGALGEPIAIAEFSGDHSWVELMFTVNPDEIGGSSVADSIALECERGEVAAGLFSHVFADPTLYLYPDELETTRVVGASESGTDDDAIAAVDYHMTLYELDLDLSAPLSPDLPGAPTVYFTIDRDDVYPDPPVPSPVPTTWWDTATTPSTSTTPSAASILQTTWDAGSSAWSEPRVIVSADAIGLDPMADAIDALAVQANTGSVVFSLSCDSTFTVAPYLPTDPQIEALHLDLLAVPPTIRVYAAPTPTGGPRPVGELLDSGRAIGDWCLRDPGTVQPPAPGTLEYHTLAFRDDPRPVAGEIVDLYASGARTNSTSTGRPVFRTWLQGPKVRSQATVVFSWETWMAGGWVPQSSISANTRYTGRPVTFGLVLDSLSSWPAWEPLDGNQRVLAQWTMVIDGVTHVSPLLVLPL